MGSNNTSGNNQSVYRHAAAGVFVDTFEDGIKVSSNTSGEYPGETNTVILIKPAKVSNLPSGYFSFNGTQDNAASFQVKLDTEDWKETFDRSIRFYDLPDGIHTFLVRAVDFEGNIDSSPAFFTWTIDTVPPTTQILSAPAQTSPSPDATFVLDSETDADAKFEYQTGNSNWVRMESNTLIFRGLIDGEHSVKVRAIDPAGNIDPTPVSYTWTIDTKAPVAVLANLPNAYVNYQTVNIAVGGQNIVAYRYALDNNSLSSELNAAVPLAFGNIPEGQHTIKVVGKSNAGVWQTNPTLYTWTVDLTAPETVILSPTLAEPPVHSTYGTFIFESNESNCKFECKLDNGAWERTLGAYTYSGLADGAHTFQVRAIDSAGNTDPTPASYTWSILTGAPIAVITNAPTGYSNRKTVSISIAGVDVQSYRWSLDGVSYSPELPTSSFINLVNMPDGQKTLYVIGKSSANTWQIIPTTVTWIVDTALPNTIITPTAGQYFTLLSITITCNKPTATIYYSVNGSTFIVYSGPFSLMSSSTVQYYAIDLAGNIETTKVANYDLSYSTPETSIASAPNSRSNNINPYIWLTASKPNCTFEYKLDGATVWTQTGETIQFSNLAVGAHTVYARATDSYGNIDPTPASYSWTIDLAPPETTITIKPSDPSGGNVSFTFTSSEPNSTFEYQIDSGLWELLTVGLASTQNETTGHLTFIQSNGSHTFRVRAIDYAGNVDLTPATYSWSVDAVAPNTTIATKPASVANYNSGSFTFSSDKQIQKYMVNIDNTVWESTGLSNTYNYSGLSAGAHSIQVYAVDTYGNSDLTTAQYSWLIDMAVPDVTITSTPKNFVSTNSNMFTFQSASDLSASFEWRIDGGAWIPTTDSFVTVTTSTDGMHTFEVRSVDAAGNKSLADSELYTVRTGNPDTLIITKPPRLNAQSIQSFTFGSSPAGLTQYSVQVNDGVPVVSTSNYSFDINAQIPVVNGYLIKVTAYDEVGHTDATPAEYRWYADYKMPILRYCTNPPLKTNLKSGTFTFKYIQEGSFPQSPPVVVDAPPTILLYAGEIQMLKRTLVNDPYVMWKGDGMTVGGVLIDPLIATTSALRQTNLYLNDGIYGNIPATGLIIYETDTQKFYIGNATDIGGVPYIVQQSGISDLSPLRFYEVAVPPTNVMPNGDVALLRRSLPSDPYTLWIGNGINAGGILFTGTITTSIDTGINRTVFSDGQLVYYTDAQEFRKGDGLTIGGIPYFVYTGTFRLKLDGGSFFTSGPSYNFSNLSDGFHTLTAIAVSAVGLESSLTDYTWEINTVPPVITFTTKPNLISNTKNINFVWTADKTIVKYEYQLDNGAWIDNALLTGFSTVADTGPAGDKAYVFKVRATDEYGNIGTGIYNWTIDTAPPNTNIITNPAAITNQTSADFTFTASEANCTFKYKLDSGVYVNLGTTASVNLTGLSAGSHTFYVYATDPATNFDGSPATYTWTVDTLAPNASITVFPTAVSSINNPSFTFSSSETGTFETNLDNAGWIANGASTTKAFSGLADGSHTFQVRTTDQAGNVDPTPASYTWSILTGSPTLNFTSNPADPSANPIAVFSWSSNRTCTYGYSLTGQSGLITSIPSGFVPTTQTFSSLVSGSHTLSLTATDAAGNTNTISYTWTVALAGIISGFVRDASTGVGLSGALVTITGTNPVTIAQNINTAADGSYSAGVSVGDYSVIAGAVGYGTVVTSTSAASGVTTTLNLSLAKTFDGYSIVFSWSITRDLDSYLYTPSMYKLFYASGLLTPHTVQTPTDIRAGSDLVAPFATLDTDSGNIGPETIRIYRNVGSFESGTYQIWLHNYAGRAGSGPAFNGTEMCFITDPSGNTTAVTIPRAGTNAELAWYVGTLWGTGPNLTLALVNQLMTALPA